MVPFYRAEIQMTTVGGDSIGQGPSWTGAPLGAQTPPGQEGWWMMKLYLGWLVGSLNREGPLRVSPAGCTGWGDWLSRASEFTRVPWVLLRPWLCGLFAGPGLTEWKGSVLS